MNLFIHLKESILQKNTKKIYVDLITYEDYLVKLL